MAVIYPFIILQCFLIDLDVNLHFIQLFTSSIILRHPHQSCLLRLQHIIIPSGNRILITYSILKVI